MNDIRLFFSCLSGILLSTALLSGQPSGQTATAPSGKSPRIVNIINFVRLIEPRTPAPKDPAEGLYQTTVKQLELINRYHLPTTYLLQYDALIAPHYQKLFNEQLQEGSEIGGWWEITQPHVEAAGMQWRGRYSWDWHANVGFATGYTPQEREKLVDIYMEKFKEVFGRYPASVGSWFIDAHTLKYMVDKYHITASCNCRDQVGTDGYTLWGGYWNQGYYPSRKNAYMPAQDTTGQIGVPVFRMLGSDPVYQYESGDGVASGLRTLEPGCSSGGGKPDWCEWFFKVMTEDPCLNYNYIQVGQENAFTWPGVREGFEFQIPLVDSLRKAGAIRVETLGETGRWYKKHFAVTPPTSVSALSGYEPADARTVWYDSRFYRTNLYWEENGRTFRIRDLHLFNEEFASDYLTEPGTSTECIYKTLPVIDGFAWSRHKSLMAGYRLVVLDGAGRRVEISGREPIVTEPNAQNVQVEWPLNDGLGSLLVILKEDRMEIGYKPENPEMTWMLEFTCNPEAELPLTAITPKMLKAQTQGFTYAMNCLQGTFARNRDGDPDCRYRILPVNNKIVLLTDTRKR